MNIEKVEKDFEEIDLKYKESNPQGEIKLLWEEPPNKTEISDSLIESI